MAGFFFFVVVLQGQLEMNLDNLEERMLFEQMLYEMQKYAENRAVKFQDVLG